MKFYIRIGFIISLVGCSGVSFTSQTNSDAGANDAGVQVILDADTKADSTSAIMDASADSIPDVVLPPPVLLDCDYISGTYLVATRVLFSDCNFDAGADASDNDASDNEASDADVSEAGLDDASISDTYTDSIYETFTAGYQTSDKFTNCAVVDALDVNACSGMANIECDNTPYSRLFSNRYYIKNINAANLTVYSDVEYQDKMFQTYVCHETLILNYYRQ